MISDKDRNEYIEVCLYNQELLVKIYKFVKSIQNLPEDSEKNRHIKLCLESKEGEDLIKYTI
jgi:hypothetical protein